MSKFDMLLICHDLMSLWNISCEILVTSVKYQSHCCKILVNKYQYFTICLKCEQLVTPFVLEAKIFLLIFHVKY